MKKLKAILPFNKIFLLLFIFLFFYVLLFTKIITYESKYDLSETFLEGKIESYSINGNALKLDVLGKEHVKATYYIDTEEEKEWLISNVKLGSTVKLNGEFKVTINNTIPNIFNYKKYLYNHKIFHTFTIKTYEFSDDLNFLYKIKDFLLKRIYKMENNDYLLIFLLGDKSLISSEEYSGFQINGTAHLLAISGMHIGVLIGLLNFILKKFKENIRFIVISLILLFFAFLTNFSASVNRVILFFVLMHINKMFNSKFSNLEILFLTGSILVLINPFIVYDYGFLYSLIITAGIIYYNDLIKGNYLVKLFKLSVITFLFSLPITASLNYEINLVSILANLVFVPFVSFIVYPWSLVSIIIPNFVWKILVNTLIWLNNLFVKFSIVLTIPKMPFSFILLYYLFLLLGKNRKRLRVFLIIIVFLNGLVPKLDPNYYVYFLDVGQGDSAVFIGPYQKEVVMIDTGGKIAYQKESWAESNKTYNLSDNSIKFLKSLGITEIDYLILSHGDEDHAGEALHLTNNLHIKNIVLNNGSYNYLEEQLLNMKIPIVKDYRLKDFQIYNLNLKDYNNENDNSIVNYITFLNYKLLFMGDAPIKTEKDILKNYDLESIDILKVGHHGSKTSSSKDFIDNIDPKYSVISVGRNNRYGHPNNEALENLKNSKIYRTDVDGSIMFKFKNGKLDIRICPP